MLRSLITLTRLSSQPCDIWPRLNANATHFWDVTLQKVNLTNVPHGMFRHSPSQKPSEPVCYDSKHIYWEERSINGRMHWWLRHFRSWILRGWTFTRRKQAKTVRERTPFALRPALRCTENKVFAQRRQGGAERRSTVYIKAFNHSERKVNRSRWGRKSWHLWFFFFHL